MSTGDLVRTFWLAIERRDWVTLRALLADDFEAEWPQSDEHLGRDLFVEINRRYPGDWHLAVRTVVVEGETAASEVEVAIDGRIDRAVSFFRVERLRIRHLLEYWPEPMEIPEWRRALTARGAM